MESTAARRRKAYNQGLSWLRRLAVVAALSGGLVANRPAAALSFEDHFAGVQTTMPDGSTKLYPDQNNWGFTFWPGVQSPNSYGDGTNWLAGNGDSESYLTPFMPVAKPLPAAQRYDPFTIQPDGLHIRASVLSPEQQSVYKVTSFHRFGSGMLISKFSFQYGTVTMVAKLPKAKGSWPALWMLPTSHAWPPELDIFEAMPWAPHAQQIHSGVILPTGVSGGFGDWYNVGTDLIDNFHTYSLTWAANTMSMRFDGTVIWTKPTPPALQTPMYLLVTYAVGGKWPYNELQVQPIDSTAKARLGVGSNLIQGDYPADMVIKSIKVTP
ncbi:MAG TPA: glycoside hydrolase family 16 protein [Aliidongia sp.]|nr:glycoside hydrolase family 16 protein [Aliidongia sp.]